ncbi:MAG: hypothetical protein DRP63_01055 [Planctomycetota bacterium]|nr:MAG: hypothetical protein DRP63_01055 [Planctomycetota bacterium]
MRPMLLVVTTVCFSFGQDTSRNSLTIPPAVNTSNILNQIDALIRRKNYEAAAVIINRALQKPSLVRVGKTTYHPLWLQMVRRKGTFPERLRAMLSCLQEREARKALGARKETEIEELLGLARRYPFSSSGREALERAADIAFEAGNSYLAYSLYSHLLKLGAKSRSLQQKLLAVKTLLPSEKAPKTAPVHAHSLRLKKRFWLPVTIRVTPTFFPSTPTFYHLSASYAFQRFYIATNNAVVEINPKTLKKRIFYPPQDSILGFVDYDYCSTVSVCERFVLAPFVVSLTKERFNVGIPAKAQIPLRSVAVFDRRSAKFLFWLHKVKGFRERFGDMRWSIQQPPVVVGSIAYGEIKTYTNTINSYIAAFDLAARKLLFAQIFCSNGVELTLWEFIAREPPSTPPVLYGRYLFVVSNLGAVACFDTFSRNILWVSEYEQFRIVSRFPHTNYPTYRRFCWLFSKPVVVDGILVTTPIDSPFVYAFDVATGKMRWRLRHDILGADLRLLAGCLGKNVLLVGRRTVCLNAKTGKLLWCRSGNIPLGMAARTKDGLLVTGLEGTLELRKTGVRGCVNVRFRGNLCSGERYVVVVSEREAMLVESEE